MAKEIERKYLVANSQWQAHVSKSTSFKQGYLNYDPERTIRVRTAETQAFLTIKGMTTGLSRDEYEYEIPLADALAMLKLCEHPPVEKVRHLIPHGNHIWELDVFEGANEGLVLAEIELASEEEGFELPVWLGAEVSGDRRYSNSTLSLQPYTTWK
jgi:adenylate cyclase